MGAAVKVGIVACDAKAGSPYCRAVMKRPRRAQELGWKRSDAVIGTKLMFGGPGKRASERRPFARYHVQSVCAPMLLHDGRLVGSGAQCGGAHWLHVGQHGSAAVAGPNDVGLSRKHIVEGVRASLQRLDMVCRTSVLISEPSFDHNVLIRQHASRLMFQQTPDTMCLQPRSTWTCCIVTRLIQRRPSRRRYAASHHSACTHRGRSPKQHPGLI